MLGEERHIIISLGREKNYKFEASARELDQKWNFKKKNISNLCYLVIIFLDSYHLSLSKSIFSKVFIIPIELFVCILVQAFIIFGF